TPDGFRCDVDGNLWCGWGMTPQLDGVRIFNPAGEPIGHVALPERCANVCFGGRHRNRLFMAASHSLYALYGNTQGARGGRMAECPDHGIRKHSQRPPRELRNRMGPGTYLRISR